MRPRTIIRTVITLAVLFAAWSASTQYNKEYFFYMGRRFMMDNKYQDAINTLNVLLRFDEDAYEGYFLRGIAKYNLDDLLGADADFTIAIEKNPVFTNAYTYRAITRSRLGNYDDALKDFHEAIELRPDLPGPYYSRGVTRLLNQQFKEAISDFDMFIRQEKKVADAYINRGMCYLYLKDTLKAYEDFETGIRTNREDPNGYNRRGTLYMQQKRFTEAEQDFDTAIKYDSAYIPALFNRAVVYSDTQRPLLALKDLNSVIALDSTNSLAYFNRAIIRSQIGDYNNALSDYDRVAEYSPNNVLVYYNRANLYTQVGEIENAVQDYTKAISLYPDFANAYLNRSYLKFLLNDPAGARSDRQTAERKIAEYRSRLSDSTYSIYADTTQKFDKLLSFDAKMAGDTFETTAMNSNEAGPKLLPMFKFTLMYPDSAIMVRDEIYYAQRAEDFKQKIGNPLLILSRDESNIAPDSLVAMDRALLDTMRTQDPTWVLLFQRGVTQSLIKQYTNAVNTLSLAIADNPSNPFLYINRSTTRAEMIDFISSIDNTYQRISIDSDPANRLRNAGSRTYDYNDAIEDINNAIKLYPTFAYSYYNRACLNAISGHLPEAYDDYTKAIELNPDFGEAYYNRGLVQIFMKDTRKGCLDLSKAGELGIENAYEALKYYTAGTIDQ